MMIELARHLATHVLTQKKVELPQYKIMVDGQLVGYIGWAEGSPISLIRRFGPIERRTIESEVAKILERRTPASTQPPEKPADFDQQPEAMEITIDDFAD